MKIIVSGSKDFSDQELLSAILSKYTRENKVTTIVLGQEPGAETMAAEWAMKNSIRLAIVPTCRKTNGPEDIISRNKQLVAKHKDAVSLLHFVGSSLSEDLCQRSFENNIPVDDVIIQ